MYGDENRGVGGAGVDTLLCSHLSCAPMRFRAPTHNVYAPMQVSPVEYLKEGQGSLMQCVITPAVPYMSWTNERIAAETDRQVRAVSASCVLGSGFG